MHCHLLLNAVWSQISDIPFTEPIEYVIAYLRYLNGGPEFKHHHNMRLILEPRFLHNMTIFIIKHCLTLVKDFYWELLFDWSKKSQTRTVV